MQKRQRFKPAEAIKMVQKKIIIILIIMKRWNFSILYTIKMHRATLKTLSWKKTKNRWIYRLNFVVSIILQMFVSMNFGYIIDGSFFLPLKFFKWMDVLFWQPLTSIRSDAQICSSKWGKNWIHAFEKEKKSESRTYKVDCILFFKPHSNFSFCCWHASVFFSPHFL